MSDYTLSEPNAIALIQLQMAEELRSKGVFADITISVDEPEVLGSELDNIVYAAGGILLLIEEPTGTNTKPGVISALYYDLTFSILVMENTELNRCEQGKRTPALTCVIESQAALHGFRPAGANIMLQAMGWEPAADPKLLSYRSNFKTAAVVKTNADRRERHPV